MKVVHISTHHSTGAGTGAVRVHSSLYSQNVHSNLLTQQHAGKSKIPNHSHYHLHSKKFTSSLTQIDKFKKKIDRLSSQGKLKRYHAQLEEIRHSSIGTAYSWVSGVHTPFQDLAKLPIVKDADIIHLHWAADFLGWGSFFETVGQEKPIVWRMWDCHAFSPAVHFNIDYPLNSKSFPNLSEEFIDKTRLFFNTVYKDKKDILSRYQPNLHITTPTKWLKKLSSQSELFNSYPHSVIPSSLDVDKFHPLNKRHSQAFFDLPEGVNLLFLASRLNEKRKGLHFLLKALENLDTSLPINLLLAGGLDNEIIPPKGVKLIHLGSIDHWRILRTLYCAADACVIPSLEDNLPNVFMESLACGTPVVGFPVGGVEDALAEDPEGGVLCSDMNATALNVALDDFLGRLESFQQEHVREIALKYYHPERQAKSYIELYQSLL